MSIRGAHRAQTAPGGAVAVQPALYGRSTPDNGAETAWSAAFDLTPWSIPSGGVLWQADTQTGIALASIGATADRVNQFELTRQPADPDDTLTGTWTLLQIVVEFS